MGIYSNIWWVVALPVFGFLVQALTGKIVVDNLGSKTGKWVMGFLACLPIFVGFGIAAQITAALASENPAIRDTHVLRLFDWINVQSLSIPFEFRVDTLSMTMVLIITGVGALIHLYATGYMAEEPDYPRFFTYLNLFIACMLCLVLGNNLVMLFIGWEGVGLCSYLLIGFWYKDVSNSKAANKAFIVNRIGDYGLTLGMFLLIFLLSTNRDMVAGNDPRWLSYDVILPHAQQLFTAYPAVATAIALLLFVGAMGKSAQFPLYIWLPDAMAGPTPVSALIHAATMVTSGVFLLNRMHVVFDASPVAKSVVAIIGAVTALLGSLIAFGQTDIKKVLAFSTVSQLGYMFIACGTGAYWAGLFHVTTHAFFKALLFLGAGAVIHAMSHDQDMRHYGNLFKYIRITAITMIIGWLAIAGLPPLAGFFSKDEILGLSMNSGLTWGGFPVGQVASGIGFVTAFLTAAYMTRMTMLTFFSGQERWKLIPDSGHGHGEAHTHHGHHAHHAHHGHDEHGFFYTEAEIKVIEARTPHAHHHELDSHHVPHEVPISMWLPLAVLALLSVTAGMFLTYVAPLKTWLYPALAQEAEKGGIPTTVLMGISVLAAVAGVALGYFQYRKGLPESEGFDLAKWAVWRKLASRQFGIDAALADGSVSLGGAVGNATFSFDKLVVDGIVNGAAYLAGLTGGLFGKSQRGYVRGYAMLIQVGAVALLLYLAYAYAKGVGL